jgi:hypothetical protein
VSSVSTTNFTLALITGLEDAREHLQNGIHGERRRPGAPIADEPIRASGHLHTEIGDAIRIAVEAAASGFYLHWIKSLRPPP